MASSAIIEALERYRDRYQVGVLPAKSPTDVDDKMRPELEELASPHTEELNNVR